MATQQFTALSDHVDSLRNRQSANTQQAPITGGARSAKMRQSRGPETEDAQKAAALFLGQEEIEVFGVVFLDCQRQTLGFEKLFFGTSNACRVSKREVARAALLKNAAAVILTHNHPSGNPSPSFADWALTHDLVVALKFVEIDVLDHVIVAGGRTVSMATLAPWTTLGTGDAYTGAARDLPKARALLVRTYGVNKCWAVYRGSRTELIEAGLAADSWFPPDGKRLRWAPRGLHFWEARKVELGADLWSMFRIDGDLFQLRRRIPDLA